MILRAPASMRSALKSVTISTRFSSSSLPRAFEATGLVNAPGRA